MRTILFKGKSIKSGEWIEGCLLIDEQETMNTVTKYSQAQTYNYMRNR